MIMLSSLFTLVFTIIWPFNYNKKWVSLDPVSISFYESSVSDREVTPPNLKCWGSWHALPSVGLFEWLFHLLSPAHLLNEGPSWQGSGSNWMEGDSFTCSTFPFYSIIPTTWCIIHLMINFCCLFPPLECKHPNGQEAFLFCSYSKSLLQYLAHGTNDKYLLNKWAKCGKTGIWYWMSRKLCLRHKASIKAGVTPPQGLPRVIRTMCVQTRRE